MWGTFGNERNGNRRNVSGLFGFLLVMSLARCACGYVKVPCIPTPWDSLRRILGTAFNPRYMSMDFPESETLSAQQDEKSEDSHPRDQEASTAHSEMLTFYVNPGFSRILPDEPVVDYFLSQNIINQTDFKSKEVRFRSDDTRSKNPQPMESIMNEEDSAYVKQDGGGKRSSRSVKRAPDYKNMPWMCHSRLEWRDLGQNYFPRYLRQAVCTTDRCWYGHLRCRGRAFTVKVLRRREDSCSLYSGSYNVDHRVPEELQERWMFEEISVTFCCECSLT